MGSLLAIMLLMWAIIGQSEANTHQLDKETLEVFEWGKFTPERVTKSTLKVFKPPKELVIISPKEDGVYPLLFFVHGTDVSSDGYIQLFNFIASHGIIVVAPLFYRLPLMPSHQTEIDDAASVLNWLSENINSVKSGKPPKHILPDSVTANLKTLTVSGHSRGGKTAFALVLGKTYKTTFDPKIISALIALDPVTGTKFPFESRTEPAVLTGVANSLDIPVPTTVIGMGILGAGNQSFISCAPKGLNHEEFYKECKEGSHFVLTEYGHCDVLDDSWFNIITKKGCGSAADGSYDVARKTRGGLMVAFLDAYIGGNPKEFHAILSNPLVAPTKLYPVENKVRPRLYYDA